jgi:hypothetical protein
MTNTLNTGTIVFQNLAACSAAIGLPIELLEIAKVHPTAIRGTNGFQVNGRVYWTPTLAKWFEATRPELLAMQKESKEYWEKRYTRAKALKEEALLALKNGRLVEKEKAKESIRTAGAAASSILNSRFGSDMAMRVQGRSVADTQAEFGKVLGEIAAVMDKAQEQWSKP